MNQNKYRAREYLKARAAIDVPIWSSNRILHNSSYFLGPNSHRVRLTRFRFVLMAYSLPVVWLYLGSRWRGQGINLNS